MKHVVAYKPYICPKCNKENFGSAEAILDLLICPKCAEFYRNELMPQIEKLVRDYFQPERSKREDLKMCLKCKKSYEGESKYICNCCLKDYEPLKNTNLRCGTLNTMET